MLQPLRKAVWWFFNKLNKELPYDPSSSTTGYIPKKIENKCAKNRGTKTCIRIFIAALLIKAKR